MPPLSTPAGSPLQPEERYSHKQERKPGRRKSPQTLYKEQSDWQARESVNCKRGWQASKTLHKIVYLAIMYVKPDFIPRKSKSFRKLCTPA